MYFSKSSFYEPCLQLTSYSICYSLQCLPSSSAFPQLPSTCTSKRKISPSWSVSFPLQPFSVSPQSLPLTLPFYHSNSTYSLCLHTSTLHSTVPLSVLTLCPYSLHPVPPPPFTLVPDFCLPTLDWLTAIDLTTLGDSSFW